jgi:hypothetical protein
LGSSPPAQRHLSPNGKILTPPLYIFLPYAVFVPKAVSGFLSNKFNCISGVSRRYKDTPRAELSFD